MQWTINGQKVTSLSDIYNLPDGMLNNILSGFALSHVLTYGIIAFAVWKLFDKINTNNNPITLNYNNSDNGSSTSVNKKFYRKKRARFEIENEVKTLI